MVYGYEANKEFIDKTYQLLEKLEDKGLWNKDTLIIGLDKGVRPLAYTLRKLSKGEKQETPDIRFFNFEYPQFGINATSEELRRMVDIKKLEKYKNVILLDEHLHTGATLNESKAIFEKYFSNSKNSSPPEIHLAALGAYRNGSPFQDYKENFIFLDDEIVGFADSEDTGVMDKASENYNRSTRRIIKESMPINEKRGFNRNVFLTRRAKLSKDINEYLHEKHSEKYSKESSLEKIISGLFILSFLGGLVLSFGNLTGNIIGVSFSDGNKFLGIILTLLGISGFFISKKLR